MELEVDRHHSSSLVVGASSGHEADIIHQLRNEQLRFNTAIRDHAATIDSLHSTIATLKRRNRVLVRAVRASDRRVETNTLSEITLYGREFGQEQHITSARRGAHPGEEERVPLGRPLSTSSSSSDVDLTEEGDVGDEGTPGISKLRKDHRAEFAAKIQAADPRARERLSLESTDEILRPFEDTIRAYDEQLRSTIKEAVTNVCNAVLLDAQHLVFNAGGGGGCGSPLSIDKRSQVIAPIKFGVSLEDPLLLSSEDSHQHHNSSSSPPPTSLAQSPTLCGVGVVVATGSTLSNSLPRTSSGAVINDGYTRTQRSSSMSSTMKTDRYHLRQKITIAVDRHMRLLHIPSVLDTTVGIVANHEYEGPPHSPLVPLRGKGQSGGLLSRLRDAIAAKDSELRCALLEKHRNIHLLHTLSHSYTTIRNSLQGQHAKWSNDTRRIIDHAFRLGEKRGFELGKKSFVRGGGVVGGGDSFREKNDDDDEGAHFVTFQSVEEEEGLWAMMKEGLLDAYSVEPTDGWGKWRANKRRRQTSGNDSAEEGGHMAQVERQLDAQSKLSDAIAIFTLEGLDANTKALRQQLRQKYLYYKVHALQLTIEQQKETFASALRRNVVLERHLQAYTISSGTAVGAAPSPADDGDSVNAVPKVHFTQFLKLPSNSAQSLPTSSIPISLTVPLSSSSVGGGSGGAIEVGVPRSDAISQDTKARERDALVGGSDGDSSDDNSSPHSTPDTLLPMDGYDNFPSSRGGGRGDLPTTHGDVPERYLDENPPVKQRHVEQWRTLPPQIGSVPTPHLNATPPPTTRKAKPVLTASPGGGHRPSRTKGASSSCDHIPLAAFDVDAEDDQGAVLPTTSQQILYAFGREGGGGQQKGQSDRNAVKAQIAELTSHVSLIRELERSAALGDSGAYRSYLSGVVSESLATGGDTSSSRPALDHSRRSTPTRRDVHRPSHPPTIYGSRTLTPLSARFEDSSMRGGVGGYSTPRRANPSPNRHHTTAMSIVGRGGSTPTTRRASTPTGTTGMTRDDALIENVWGYLRRTRQ